MAFLFLGIAFSPSFYVNTSGTGLRGHDGSRCKAKNLNNECGRDNGAGGCDIDISNLAISGKANGMDAQDNLTLNAERASTSAELKNPFIEFAINNPNQVSTREVKGFRLSAESITGYVTAEILNKEPIYIPLGSSVGAALGLPIYKNVGSLDLSSSGAAALTLRNQVLGNQEVKSNCFGGLKFC